MVGFQAGGVAVDAVVVDGGAAEGVAAPPPPDEEARRQRVAHVVAQEPEEPLLERTCSICLTQLGDESDYGPAIQLGCHPDHCVHASCVGRAWAAAPDRDRRCPLCRRPSGTSMMWLSATAGAEHVAARAAEQQRVASEWEAQAAWDELQPCTQTPLPPAHAPTQPVAGGWHAID